MPQDRTSEEQDQDDDRGRKAGFDRSTGEVHGSGAAAGGSGDPGEDYDRDPKGGSGANATDTGSVREPKR